MKKEVKNENGRVASFESVSIHPKISLLRAPDKKE